MLQTKERLHDFFSLIKHNVSHVGFTGDLRKATGGQAFPQCVFDHWQVVNYDPLAVHPQDIKDPAKVKQFYDNNQAYKIMMKIRKRRGLKEEQPKLDDYFDRM